jgi:thiol-disulfide isomerase/thioredoxin
MKRIISLAATIIMACSVHAQQTVSYKIEDLLKRVSNQDTVYVVNFWATWCAPCVKELPEFDKVSERYSGRPVKVLLVSLDFKEAYPKKLESFISKKKLKPEVVWFNETNANMFIPKIDNSWSGSIPATWIVNKAKDYTTFNEGTVTPAQIGSIIEWQLTQ